MKVVLSNTNHVGKVTFAKAGKNITRLRDLIDVNISGQSDRYALEYDAATDTYIFREAAQTATIIDGGTY
jgi:hypothetical protein